MKVSSTHEKTLKMVQIAFLAAVEIVLTFFNFNIGGVSMNFGLVPIVIAGIILGPKAGFSIGAVSGFVTMIQVITCYGPSAYFYAFLMGTNPIVACLLCLVKTSVAGAVAGLVFKCIQILAAKSNHKRSLRVIGAIGAGAVCPVVNTGIFALGMLTVFSDALMKEPVLSTIVSGGLIATVFLGLIGINFIIELVSTVIITPPVSEAVFPSKLFKK